MQYAVDICTAIESKLGISIQDWYSVDQHIPVSVDTTEAPLRHAYEAGATVYQVEGTSGGKQAGSQFITGIETLLRPTVV